MSKPGAMRSIALIVSVGLALAAGLVQPLAANATPVAPAVFGTVTPEAGSTAFSGSMWAILTNAANGTTLSSSIDGSGHYEISNITPGSYRLSFAYQGGGDWATTPWTPPGGVEGDAFSIAAGQTVQADGPLRIGGVIAGTIGLPAGTWLTAPDTTVKHLDGTLAGHSSTNANTNTFRVSALSAGDYKVYFSNGNSSLIISEYWGDTRQWLEAAIVHVDWNSTTTINPQLSAIPSVTGVVSYRLENGTTAPLRNATVTMLRLQDYSSWPTTTDSKGRYYLPDVGGEFTLSFTTTSDTPVDGLVGETWNDAYGSGGTVLDIVGDQVISGISPVLERAATISGRVMYTLGTPHSASDAEVTLLRLSPVTGRFEMYAVAYAGSNGTYTFDELPEGHYKVRVTDTARGLGTRYWPNATTLAAASEIVVEFGEVRALTDMTLLKRDIEVSRLSGADRFDTAVAISRAQFPDDADLHVPVVYVANGLNYPDALAAGPAAIEKGGGLLLVLPTGIPSSVADELDRLNPDKIIVVGSATAVSNSVKTQLAEFVDSPSDVIRLGGADRFETAELVIKNAFPEEDTLNGFFATGFNYPDALAAGPAAGLLHAPIFLVNGGADVLPQHTIDLMSDLGVGEAYVVGGPPAISAGAFAAIGDALTPHGPYYVAGMSQLAGPDRYSTAVAVNQSVMRSDVALLATGTGYADALAGGPLAGSLGVPMYLSTPTCVPNNVLADLIRIGVTKVILLGGESALSSGVRSLTPCS